ncbi:MAG: peroxiredoxin family protein [Candidatus Nitrospinota bacterium M3_3B_026]
MCFIRTAALALALSLAGCGGMGDDLRPSGADESGAAETEGAGAKVGQNAPGFSMPDINGASRGLEELLEGRDAVVLYFTMWCPICYSHVDHMRRSVIPAFPGTRFVLVDYVSGSVENSRAAAAAAGYANTSFTILVDEDQAVLRLFGATMGTTVVIDGAGVVRMNEDYKQGSKLDAVLEAL